MCELWGVKPQDRKEKEKEKRGGGEEKEEEGQKEGGKKPRESRAQFSLEIESQQWTEVKIMSQQASKSSSSDVSLWFLSLLNFILLSFYKYSIVSFKY